MGVMKRRVILLSLLLSVVAAVPSMSAVTPRQATDAEYLMNAGYSQLTAEDVLVLKNRANGNAPETLYRKDSNGFVRGWKAFWGYIDPARDEFDRVHHNVQPSPAFSDL